MKCEKVYLQPELDEANEEIQKLRIQVWELQDELTEVKYHIKSLLKFVNGWEDLE